MPPASLGRVVGDTLPPPAVTDQVTRAPGSAAPALSRTITANDSGNAAAAATWLSPALSVIEPACGPPSPPPPHAHSATTASVARPGKRIANLRRLRWAWMTCHKPTPNV